MSVERFETQWGGKNLIIETGKFARQANGACTVQYGDTMVLATAVLSKNTREGIDFFPLMVDYEEKLYAAGKIKSSRFMKREGRPSDEAILSGRLVDRAIRPLFPEGLRNDIQVILTVLSVDGENDSDVPAIVAGSVALAISDIPWDGPIAGARVGFIPSAESTTGQGGEWVLNPTFEARGKSTLDLFVAGTADRVLMLEAGAKEISEELVEEGIAFGQKHLGKILKLITEVQEKTGKKKRAPAPSSSDDEVTLKEESARAKEETRLVLQQNKALLFGQPRASKIERRDVKDKLYALADARLKELGLSKEARTAGIKSVESGIEDLVTEAILREGKRVDGRTLTDIRPLQAEVAVPPRIHGSALFERGDTQVLATLTLGAPGLEQTLEGMEVSGKVRFFHHYNFPPFSVGETKPLRGPGRREIGHGALAERALLPVIPDDKEKFPYTMRLVSEVFSSNGSSSMASVCAASLALFDGGVPVKKAVAGIAMGLASNDKGEYKILTDLQDLEDGKGGMDFKVAGTRDGITAIQLDTKTKGLSSQIVREALTQAKAARLKILDTMDAALSAPRPELSPYAPRIVSFKINPERIRDVIGPGGKIINEIIDATGVQIDIEDDGLVMVTSTSPEASEKAVAWIKNLTREVKAGEIFEGKVTRLMDFGAFVEVLPKQEGLVHISELAHYRVGKVTDILNIGDTVKVKVLEIDNMGRLNLSRKALIDPSAEQPPAGYNPDSGGSRGGFSGGGGRPPHRGFGGGGGRGGGRGGFGPSSRERRDGGRRDH
ncbi:polyribonucleotide nucleotidyltransferase [Candidatus Uhrbacteria bacterium]|nr:polyribonucleotide nucleotidyltransferase [Candidatus Uhrbacteria bacterium]